MGTREWRRGGGTNITVLSPLRKPRARIHTHTAVRLERRDRRRLCDASRNKEEEEERQQHCRGHNKMLLTASSKTESVGCVSPVASS